MGPKFCAAMHGGFREGAQRYGLLLDALEPALVDGFVYLAARPVGAPKSAKGPPPKAIFKLLTWLHPEVRRRIRRAKDVFDERLWRKDAEEWDRDWKPRIAKKNAALLAVDPKKLDTEALVAHCNEIGDAVVEAVRTHHRFSCTCMLPTGDYLAQASEWTGLSHRQLLEPFRGASPVSAGATKEMARLVEALREDANARASIEADGNAHEVLRELVEDTGKIGECARAYLDVVGYRLVTGYDVADRYALELPEMLVRAIRSALAGEVRSRDDESAAATARVRDAVPDDKREAFDRLLDEARAVFRIRDERCYLNDAMTTGLARRALLEAGARLADAGKLDDPTHVVDLLPNEIEAALRGRDAPSKDTIAAYAKWRETKNLADAPEWVGAKPSGPPPAEWLPEHAARLQRAVAVILHTMFDTANVTSDSKVVRGLGAGGGCYEGTARVVLDPSSFGRVQRGDVLVARMTAPSYNVILPLLGGIVTDRGGLLSHPAIVAREYGLPAVVGCNVATTKIVDGARVRVDGTAGEVHVLSGAPT